MTVTVERTEQAPTLQSVEVPTAVLRRMLKPHRSTTRTPEVGQLVQLFTYVDGITYTPALGVASWNLDAAKVTTWGGMVERAPYVGGDVVRYHKDFRRVTVPYVMLYGALKAVGRARTVEVEVSNKSVKVGGVVVATASGKWVASLSDHLSLAYFDSVNANATYWVKAVDVRHVLAATDTSDYRETFRHVKLEAGGDSGPVIVATDRYRLHVAPVLSLNLESEGIYRKPFDVMIPGDLLRSIATHKKGNFVIRADSTTTTDGEPLTIAHDARVVFHEDIPDGIGTAAVFRCHAHHHKGFPKNWRTFFPEESKTTQTFTFGPEVVGVVESAVNLAMMVGRNNPLVVTYEDGAMVLTPGHQERLNSVRVACGHWGSSEVFALNPSYFLDMLKGMFDGTGSDAFVTLSVESSRRPVVVRNSRVNGYRSALLMPVKL